MLDCIETALKKVDQLGYVNMNKKIDFQTRMEQFYDHYLKGKPAPDRMIKGVPFLKKTSNNN